MSLKLKIHRGTAEIGGNCVEVWTETTRILIDIGMPLVDRAGKTFQLAKGLSVKSLLSNQVLPDVKGIYADSINLINGVLISHPHQDHYGFAKYLHPNLRYFIGEATFRIINTANLFTNQEQLFQNHSFSETGKSFLIGDLRITPYLMDHSAFDSYAFLIEGDGKRIFYSGDFRGHGRKSNLFKWFLHHGPVNVDYLLLEGTMIGRSTGKEKSEEDLQKDFAVYFTENKLNLVYTSGQNIDRLVSIYKACNEKGKTLIIDPYIASILLESSRFSQIHHPSDSFKNIKVIFPYLLTGRMLKNQDKKLIYRFTKFKITREEISQTPGKYVMIVRSSMLSDLERIPGLREGNLIYSLWEGYLKRGPTRSFVSKLIKKGFSLHKIHTSGHADLPTLKSFVNALNPGCIIPIHTFAGDQYKTVFSQPVLELADRQEMVIQ